MNEDRFKIKAFYPAMQDLTIELTYKNEEIDDEKVGNTIVVEEKVLGFGLVADEWGQKTIQPFYWWGEDWGKVRRGIIHPLMSGPKLISWEVY